MSTILNKSVILLFCFAFFIAQGKAETNSTDQSPMPEGKLPSKGKAFNPDISGNFLGALQWGSGYTNIRSESPHNGFSLEEVELQITSDVDPYLKGVALLAVAQEDGEWGIEPEEVYMETLSVPSVTLRAGKFKLALGKHNQLHPHAYPFLDSPLIHELLLGDEGLTELGVSAAFLLPTNWYSELIFQAFNPSNEDLFDSPSSWDIGGIVRLKNLWDMTDDLTMELGLSGTAGRNMLDHTSSVFGADLTFKWRPSEGGKYQALVWSTEYLNGNRNGLNKKLGGLATWIQYQLAQRWWVGARYEKTGLPKDLVAPEQSRMSALVGFFPSEFSGFRLGYDLVNTTGAADSEHVVALQYVISIGAHPAHAY